MKREAADVCMRVYVCVRARAPSLKKDLTQRNVKGSAVRGAERGRTLVKHTAALSAVLKVHTWE